jgi:hypothetical protein
MQVGDLIDDDHYGNGIVLERLGPTPKMPRMLKVFFVEVNKICWMDEEMIGDSVEVISASR